MSWKELTDASLKGHLATVQALLATRAATAEELREALACATIYDQHDTMRFLVGAGADPNATSTMSGSALFFASTVDSVEVLLSLGAKVSVRDAAGNDALHWHLISNGPGSRRNSDVALARRLLDAGIDVKAREADQPHLLPACAAGNLAIIELLLERGASPTVSSRTDTVFSASVASGCQGKVLGLLARHGLPPNSRWDYAGTRTSLLSTLCKLGELEHVAWLLDHGADPNLDAELLPLAAAEQSGHKVLVDLLLEKGARPLKEALDLRLTERLDATEKVVVAGDSTDARLQHARALRAAGFHAAAASEVFEVRRRTKGEQGAELLTLPTAGWAICAAPPLAKHAIAPRLADGLWPNALATDGKRVVPLVFTFGAPCTRCDEKGSLVCSMCDGTGSYSSFLDPDHDVTCDERQGCPTCLATKFTVSSKVSSRGSCRHAYEVVKNEAVGENDWFGFVRCQQCLLPGLAGGVHRSSINTHWACATCARFACGC